MHTALHQDYSSKTLVLHRTTTSRVTLQVTVSSAHTIYIYIYIRYYIYDISIRYIYIYTYIQRSAKTIYIYHIISLIVCQPPSARWGRSVNGKTFDLQGCLLRWFILNGRICMPVRARVCGSCGWVGEW